MKKIMFTVCTLLVLTFTATSQSSPTTLEEYNYLTKGYKTQIESGLDMKAGYSFKPYTDLTIGGYRFDVKYLMRKNSEVAALFILATSSVSGTTYYICLPSGGGTLLTKYMDSIKDWDYAMRNAYTRLISGLFIIRVAG